MVTVLQVYSEDRSFEVDVQFYPNTSAKDIKDSICCCLELPPGTVMELYHMGSLVTISDRLPSGRYEVRVSALTKLHRQALLASALSGATACVGIVAFGGFGVLCGPVGAIIGAIY